MVEKRIPKPEWLKINLSKINTDSKVMHTLADLGINTICESGLCPNRSECWECGTATFMICGNICTRNCGFCNVKSGHPLPIDADEPQKIANAVSVLGLKHSVITSVTRDDLADFGASHWNAVITSIKKQNPNTTLEVLIPDFQGNTEYLDMIINSGADIISHNLETVRRLTPTTRYKATYDTSLGVIKYVANSGKVAKSGIMLGIGESKDEVVATLRDLHSVGCSVVTIGQYLQPSRTNIPVVEYIKPEVFDWYKNYALDIGFIQVESGPLARSSYHSERIFDYDKVSKS